MGNRAETNGMSIAGLVFGILSLLVCWTVVLAPFMAGLAMTFACLSRGDKKMCGLSIATVVMAIISILVAAAILIFAAGAAFSAIESAIYSYH